MQESSYQFLLVCGIVILFIHSAAIALRGFRNATSWFCMVFAVGIFSQTLFTFPAAFAGNPEYAWLIGIEESTTYLQVVMVSLLSLWAGHLATRKRAKAFVGKLKVPALNFSERNIELFSSYCAFGGAFLAIIASVTGAFGYFKTTINLESPPLWHSLLSYTINLFAVLSFIVFLSSYRNAGSIKARHFVLVMLWVIAGFLSGYKTQVILPLILLAVAAWMTRRVNFLHYFALVMAIIFAYSIVEPMRDIAREARGLTRADEAFTQVVSERFIKPEGLGQIKDELIRRLDYSETAIETLQADRWGYINNYKNAIREQYELLPSLTFIPRYLWPEKPLADFGRQLSIELHNNPLNSITPSAPIVSYLAGGYFLLILSSFTVGGMVTLCGLILLKYISQPTRYAPIIILAFSLTIGEEFFSSYLMRIVRLVLAVYVAYFLFRAFGMATRARSIRPRPLS